MNWQTLSTGSSKQYPSAARWFEVHLSSQTTDDVTRYRLVMTGKSAIPGEVDRIRTETTTSAHAVVDFLAMGERGRRYIPKISRKILHEAADIDRNIGDALDDFDMLMSPS